MATKTKLVKRAKQGNTAAFEKLIDGEKEKLYKMAFIYMKNENDALEVFQETIYKALKSISMLQQDQYFSTWITRILINNAIGTLRKKKRVIPIDTQFLDGMDGSSKNGIEEQLDLLSAMDKIEVKYKTVLLLRYYDDYTIKQIAEILDCPEGTVKTNIRRGLASLKQKMKGVYCHDEQYERFQEEN